MLCALVEKLRRNIDCIAAPHNILLYNFYYLNYVIENSPKLNCFTAEFDRV